VLDVFGKVEITLGDGRQGSLVADGQKLVLDVDEAASLHGLARRGTLRMLAETLSRTGFTLHVRSGDRLLLAAGKDVESDLLSRLFHVPHARFDRRFGLRSTLTPRKGVSTMSRRTLRLRAAAAILVAAVASFALSVTLWFTGSHDQGIFVGLWVPSILSFGVLALQLVGDRGE